MSTTMESKAMDFSDVSALLWREREALELLLFKLVEEQLIVSAGQARWLAHANREIENVLEELRTTEVLRALEVDAPSPRISACRPARPWCSSPRPRRRPGTPFCWSTATP